MIPYLLILLLLASCGTSSEVSQVCSDQTCFDVTLAKTPEQHSKGLMFVKELPLNQGMLFIFEKEDYHPFWMKNTKIPLDIIWMDSKKNVIFTQYNAQPCKNPCHSINPSKKAKYVLEINAGVAKQVGITENSTLTFRS